MDDIGGYFNRSKLQLFKIISGKTIDDGRLVSQHPECLSGLKRDTRGYTLYHDKHVGIGGVYKIHKR